MNEDTYDRVVDIVTRHSTASADEITRSSDVREDLGADSLIEVAFIMSLEEEFDIDIPDEIALNLRTIGDLVDFIDS